MQVEHRLPCGWASISDETPAVETLGSGHLCGEQAHVGEHFGWNVLIERADVHLGDHQHMRGGYRVDISEGDSAFRAGDDVGRNLVGNDPTEDAVSGQSLVSPSFDKRALKASSL